MFHDTKLPFFRFPMRWETKSVRLTVREGLKNIIPEAVKALLTWHIQTPSWRWYRSPRIVHLLFSIPRGLWQHIKILPTIRKRTNTAEVSDPIFFFPDHVLCDVRSPREEEYIPYGTTTRVRQRSSRQLYICLNLHNAQVKRYYGGW